MKSDLRDLPEKTIRVGDCSYFLYSNEDAAKVTVYHKYTKVLNISIDPVLKTVTCISQNGVTYADLYQVEKLLKGVLPEEVLLLEILEKAILSKDGVITVNY